MFLVHPRRRCDMTKAIAFLVKRDMQKSICKVNKTAQARRATSPKTWHFQHRWYHSKQKGHQGETRSAARRARTRPDEVDEEIPSAARALAAAGAGRPRPPVGLEVVERHHGHLEGAVLVLLVERVQVERQLPVGVHDPRALLRRRLGRRERRGIRLPDASDAACAGRAERHERRREKEARGGAGACSALTLTPRRDAGRRGG